MKRFFSEYGLSLLYMVTGTISLVILFSLFSDANLNMVVGFTQSEKGEEDPTIAQRVPKLTIDTFNVENKILEFKTPFDYKDYIIEATAINELGEKIDVKEFVTFEGEVNTSVAGSYDVKFILRWNGQYITRAATFHVKDDQNFYVVNFRLLHGGEVANGQRVELYQDGTVIASATTDSLGKAMFANLRNGEYVLKVSGTNVEKQFTVDSSDITLPDINF